MTQLEHTAMHLDGLYTGSLPPEEYELLLREGYLIRTYEGATGLLGLSKLKYVPAELRRPKEPSL